jgi:hypothetical protein
MAGWFVGTRTKGKGNPRVVSQSGSFKNKKRLLFIDLPACIKKDRSCVSFSDLIIFNFTSNFSVLLLTTC